jgi:hypothetical protein
MRGARPILIGALVAVLVFIGLLVWAGLAGVLLETLYIILIVLAFLMVVATGAQIFSVWRLVNTINTVRAEMQPLLATVNDTVTIVKDTARTAGHTVSAIGTATNLTSDFVVGPSIRAAATVSATRQVLKTFFGRGYVRSQYEQRRRQQMAAMDGNVGEE